jgi:hypothetical protein
MNIKVSQRVFFPQSQLSHVFYVRSGKGQQGIPLNLVIKIYLNQYNP